MNLDLVNAEIEKIEALSSLSPFLTGLGTLKYSFGTKAIESVILGLSREISPTTEDVEQLIADWENRNENCCYKGSVDKLLNMKETLPVAISYRHAPRKMWDRKRVYANDEFISKMSNEDQRVLVQSILALGKIEGVEKVMLWCDQVISTRLKGRETDIAWYNNGLLPYIGLRLLHLTLDSDEDLEQRLWIRAERSLGRMSHGHFVLDKLTKEIYYKTGFTQDPHTVMNNISKQILNSNWPESTDHWKDDFQDMKKWAIFIACRCSKALHPQIFENNSKFDNIDLLSSAALMATTYSGQEESHEEYDVCDEYFYLKFTAWNPSICSSWQGKPNYMSHYMGRMGDMYRFSWWEEENTGNMFGELKGLNFTTMILAIKKQEGFKVLRRITSAKNYEHALYIADNTVLYQIDKSFELMNLKRENKNMWRLRYFDEQTEKVGEVNAMISAKFKEENDTCDITLPYVFQNITTKLFNAAEKCSNGERIENIVEKIVKLTDEWNSAVRTKYDDFISVRDSIEGPVWIEGYNDEHVTFSFLHFLTESLFTRKECCPMKYLGKGMIQMVSAAQILPEIFNLIRFVPKDYKTVIGELFLDQFEGVTEIGDAFKLNTVQSFSYSLCQKDRAMFTLCGGGSTAITLNCLGQFLRQNAKSRGYWTTESVFNDKTIEIKFSGPSGENGIIMRKANASYFRSIGLVRPKDTICLKSILIEERRLFKNEEMKSAFKNSFYKLHNTTILLADMCLTPDGECVISDQKLHSNTRIIMLEAKKQYEKFIKRDLDDIENLTGVFDLVWSQMAEIGELAELFGVHMKRTN